MGGFVPKGREAAHMARVAEHEAGTNWDALKARVVARSASISVQMRQDMADKAQRASSASAKVHWLRQEAAIISKAIQPVSPCRAGCDHCCHIGVTVTEQEARVIAKETGRKMAEPSPDRVLSMQDLIDEPGTREQKLAHARRWVTDKYTGVPCTFLRNGWCSIYEHRPIICRLHISVDTTPILCELVEGHTNTKVPYFDATEEKVLYHIVFQGRIADIRDWFPK